MSLLAVCWCSGQLMNRLFQLSAEREDLIGITQRQPTDVSEFKATPDSREQRRTKIGFQNTQLPSPK